MDRPQWNIFGLWRHGKLAAAPLVIVLWMAAADPAVARTEKDFFQNTDLNNGNNYNPSGLPSTSNDVLLTTSSTALNLSGATLNIGSLNQTSNTAYTISINNTGSTDGNISLGTGGTNAIGPDPNDLIYVGGATSSLTFQGANSGGTSPLSISQSGNFDVAQPNATLNISTTFSAGTSNGVFKTGAGMMNISAPFGGFGGSLFVDQGTVNFLPGASITTSNHFGLGVENPNTGPGSAVTVNIQTPVTFRNLFGTVATPSSGTNSAIVNLVGAASELVFSASLSGLGTSTYSGAISGSGSVRFLNLSVDQVQAFSGNNTYTGTTKVFGGTLRIDGTTSGQGNYTVTGQSPVPTMLTGSGTIGLATNGSIVVGNGASDFSRLSAGPASGTGTLHVVTSGTGKVVLADLSTFIVDVGPAGASDLLAIAGGAIDLTSSSDTLSLNSLSGAFDGSVYTITTFNQNVNSGVFNTVSGLPANYGVVYNVTNIMLAPVPEPATYALTGQILAVLLIWRYGIRRRQHIG